MDITRVYQGSNKIKVITNKNMLEQKQSKKDMITDKIVFTVNNKYVKHTVELNEFAGLEELFTAFKSMLIGLTFEQETINNYILELAESIETK